jgi:Fe2+ transport system protein FeoA
MASPATARLPIPLCELPVGQSARLHALDLDEGSAGLLHALGLTRDSDIRLCKRGEPCIVQVGGTRLGVSASVACHILVWPQNGQLGSSN